MKLKDKLFVWVIVYTLVFIGNIYFRGTYTFENFLLNTFGIIIAEMILIVPKRVGLIDN